MSSWIDDYIRDRKRRQKGPKAVSINNSTLSSYNEAKDEREEIKASLSQYSVFGGNAFMPTTNTSPQLRNGVYKVLSADNGLFFKKQDIFTDKLLRLPDSKSDEVVLDIEQFWTLKDSYAEFGLSFKRGYLLHGPPGSGKTCTINIIVANMISRDGIVIYGDNLRLVAEGLKQFRQIEPNRPLVVIIEDVDTAAKQDEGALLALLDGENQVDNVVFIATTNYPETLDARIINRPSRFDMIVKIDVPNDAARALYLQHRANTTTAPTGEDMVALTKGMSIAHLRELIVAVFCFKRNATATIERLKNMKITPKSSGGGFLGLNSGDSGDRE